MELKIVAITQARVGSSRLPAKVLKDVNGKSLLQLHLERIKKSKLITEFIVATTNEEGSQEIIKIAQSQNFKVYQGSLNYVLERFYFAVKDIAADYVVRLTSDCPLIDSEIIDSVIKTCIDGKYDYVSNTLEPTFPDGLDVEVFTMKALEQAYENASLPSEKEHVTPYIWKNSAFFNKTLFNSFCFKNSQNYSAIRLTVDEQSDLEFIIELTKKVGFYNNWLDYVQYLQSYKLHPENAHLIRNQGYIKSIKND